VTEKATLKAISILENLGSLFPAVVTGVDRAREFIKCVHIHIITTTTDIKLCGFRKKDLNYVKSWIKGPPRPVDNFGARFICCG
jgi:hypothetical protein